ncbi:GNAT family N-acetyltransferase, partial [Vibrio breoganii]
LSMFNYFTVMASQQAKKDNTRTFVLEDDNNSSHIIGFYTLTMTPIDLKALPNKLQKKHQSSTSGGLIARLAVDEQYKGKGFGEWLLIDSLRKLHAASDSVGFPIIIVDAKDGAKDFYERYGFRAFQDAENKLFITIADVRASLG